MIVNLRYCIFFVLLEFYGVGFASGYNPVTQQAQTNLTAQGFNPGVLNGLVNSDTFAAIYAFQEKSGLPKSGKLDVATLQKLAITLSEETTPAVENWQSLSTQADIDLLIKDAYADYVAYAPGVNLNIPGQAILTAMNQSADAFGSRRLGQPMHTIHGYKMMSNCLKNPYANIHWSDLTLHYYCQMSLPRDCYTSALLGELSGGVKLSRTNAYVGCANGELAKSAKFAWVIKNQALVFQYVMFAQTHAFNHMQEQAIINTFYGVEHPNDPVECRLKRPRRANDPLDGSHCLTNKVMLEQLVGIGI
ncbi:peptidoglycan-binding domain-containing protein [Crenothrix polyspora]|uniref:Peptidoglycan binding-like domain-containing protein n=1 Tax=Crenothrix polyspora TaxID=360316 RepID=A0A1R4GYY9_9GAMM|nr:peptidoglycan-binding domain-containing protein [Crenothrix polyspora]SJM89207.1 hypothetical protein CRENPOLYSF1_100071 [Crenothrix polyspora]